VPLGRTLNGRTQHRGQDQVVVALTGDNGHPECMRRTLRAIETMSRISRIVILVLYSAMIVFGIVLLAQGTLGGWVLIGIGIIGFGLRIARLLLRRRQGAPALSILVEEALTRSPSSNPPDEITRARQARALKIRVAGFCLPFTAGALIAFAFIFTATGEFKAIAITIAVVFAVIVGVMGIALLAGLRNIRTGRFASSRS
jgi:hypothetical protein